MAPLRLAFITAGVMSSEPKCAAETLKVASVRDENDLMSAAAAIKPMMKRSDVDMNDKIDVTSTKVAIIDTSSPTIESSTSVQGSGPIHFCFIVHGHQGKPTDLRYLHHTIKEKAKKHGGFAIARSSRTCTVGRSDSNDTDNSEFTTASVSRRSKRDRWPRLGSVKKKKKTDEATEGQNNEDAILDSVEDIITNSQSSSFIVHNAACNEGTTHDGVVKGGERLANEIIDVIRSELEGRRHNNKEYSDVTISIIGNSLGGLYGRYAVMQLDEMLPSSAEGGDDLQQHYILDNTIRIHFNVFCSTASPHLGCADRTFFPIPRFAEIGIAKRLGETGRDLFRVNDLMRTMATSPRFTRPLARFHKRIAYANAYGTDFVVPGSTAGFLDANSDSIHYFDADFTDDKAGDGVCPASEKGLFAATCYTPRRSLSSPIEESTNSTSEMEVMSKSLDALGWTKVFVDMRREIPISVKLPSLTTNDTSNNIDCPVKRLSIDRKSVASKDLSRAVSSLGGNHISLPFGHNSICAFERGSFATEFNKGGRPVMDSLALSLVHDVSRWGAEEVEAEGNIK